MPGFLADPPRLIVLSLFLLAGCMGKGEPAAPQSAPQPAGETVPGQAPAAAEESEGDEQAEPATLEEAEAALRRAQSELQSALGPVAFAQSPPRASQPAPAEASGSASRDRSMEAESAEKKADGPNCGLACRAFTSLSRAAQAVCRLDGDGGERCGRARKAVSDAEARVSSCGCTRP